MGQENHRVRDRVVLRVVCIGGSQGDPAAAFTKRRSVRRRSLFAPQNLTSGRNRRKEGTSVERLQLGGDCGVCVTTPILVNVFVKYTLPNAERDTSPMIRR